PPPPPPPAVEGLGGNRGEAVLGAAAAAAGGAHEKLAAEARHVHAPAVAASYDVAPPLVHAGPAQRVAAVEARTSATPISASRVISGTRSASESRSVPAGRCGSTMERLSGVESHHAIPRASGH